MFETIGHGGGFFSPPDRARPERGLKPRRPKSSPSWPTRRSRRRSGATPNARPLRQKSRSAFTRGRSVRGELFRSARSSPLRPPTEPLRNSAAPSEGRGRSSARVPSTTGAAEASAADATRRSSSIRRMPTSFTPGSRMAASGSRPTLGRRGPCSRTRSRRSPSARSFSIRKTRPRSTSARAKVTSPPTRFTVEDPQVHRRRHDLTQLAADTFDSLDPAHVHRCVGRHLRRRRTGIGRLRSRLQLGVRCRRAQGPLQVDRQRSALHADRLGRTSATSRSTRARIRRPALSPLTRKGRFISRRRPAWRR